MSLNFEFNPSSIEDALHQLGGKVYTSESFVYDDVLDEDIDLTRDFRIFNPKRLCFELGIDFEVYDDPWELLGDIENGLDDLQSTDHIGGAKLIKQ